MKIVIDTDVIDNDYLTKSQFFLLYSLLNKPTPEEVQKLFAVGYLTRSPDKKNLFVSETGYKKVRKIVLASSKLVNENTDRYETLAKSLQELYPKGKKYGTNNYWRGNLAEIKDRLKAFFLKHGDFSDDLVIKATEKYVNSFGDNRTLMKTLKYFISKKKPDGAYEYDLLTFIENIDSQDDDDYMEVATII